MYRSECLPFSEIPHTSALFLDFLYHFDRLERFLPAPLRSAQQAAEAARAVNAAYDGKRRAAVVAVLEQQNQQWGLSESARRNLERLRAGAMAIVTGQQVNLFGGPAYSFYKALTIIKVAQEFTAGGTECVPIFWLASEDHDVAEIDHVALPRPEMAALEMVRASAKGNEGAPVGRLKLDDSVLAAVARAAELLGPGEALDREDRDRAHDASDSAKRSVCSATWRRLAASVISVSIRSSGRPSTGSSATSPSMSPE